MGMENEKPLEKLRRQHRQGRQQWKAELLSDRHPGVQDGMAWLEYDHLPPQLQQYSRPFHDAAMLIIQEIPTDSPELTTAINKLIEAKDAAVRAGIRHSQGRAGSVPRPQTVVNPPALSSDEALAAGQQMISDNHRHVAGWCAPASTPTPAVPDLDPDPDPPVVRGGLTWPTRQDATED